MNLEELIRCHRELTLMMGYPAARHGIGAKYSYAIFMKDLNDVKPDTVTNLQQIKNIMAGRMKVPPTLQTACEDLLQRAISGETLPPTPGPMWSRNVPTKHVRRLAATMLDRWIVALEAKERRVARASQISVGRLNQLRNAEVPILPTELDRLAAAFGKSREDFLRGPE